MIQNQEYSKSQALVVKKRQYPNGTRPWADTSKWEEIDQLVYQLYGLSEDEVKIVEGKASSYA